MTVAQYRELGGLIGNEKVCDDCGKIFVPAKQSRRFCNEDCYGSWCTENLRGANNPFFGKHHSKSTKELLGKINSGKSSWNKGIVGQDSHCFGRKLSSETKDKMRKSALGEKNPFFGKHHTEKTKQLISKRLQGQSNPLKGKTLEEYYGSVRAAQIRELLSKSRLGPKNYNWKGGISREPYDFAFNEELKQRIRIRDHFICQLCEIPQSQNAKDGRSLAVHHIDYDKLNSSENNLISLCISCNSKVNYNRDYWKNYFLSKWRIRFPFMA